MKRISFLLSLFFAVSALAVWAADNRGGGQGRSNPAPARATNPRTQAARPPVVINLNRGTSGGHNRNFPSQQPSKPAAQQPVNRQPSYGQLNWTAPAGKTPQTQPWTPAANRGGQAPNNGVTRPNTKSYAKPGVHAAVVVHHHAYTPGYVRKKLQKIGVTTEPNLITDRSEIVHTDRQHSTITFPKKGPDHNPINAVVVSPRHFNDPIVQQQMAKLDSPDWSARINQYNSTDTQPGRHYWHQDDGVTYCHYIDPSGYHWWGWYMGDQFFWTRNFAGRWWWYDSDFDRWCFWNGGFWWWQDPYHVGDLYCYNDDGYVPCNSANDQVVVTAPVDPNQTAYNSPDGTRTVKVIGDSQDAFLYDTANPPTFDPVYLASGAQTVQFSNTSNGRPLEIILKLNDGSFDMFDGYGNPYNPGAYDNDQAAQMDGNQLPSDTATPPSSDNGTGSN